MNNSTIKIPANTKHLSDFLTELPSNCMFNKGKVGCGGTTLALNNQDNYIIAVPFVSLIENKLAQQDELIKEGIVPENSKFYGFHGKNNLKRDLMNYLNSTENVKIFVTYDSLAKLTNWINPGECKLLVDELHLLFTEYSYREVAVKGVLKTYERYEEYCFMTATPLEEQFTLDELTHLPMVTAEWENTTNVKVESMKCECIKSVVIETINDFLSGKKDGNAYFFVNSVKYIKSLVHNCDLNDDNARAIYSKSNRTNVGIENSTTTSEPKKINFITSTAFEGSDIYDEDGVTIVISDSSETHTLIDISTKFQQIAGRIRNSKHSHTIHHIYKETRYSKYVSYDEFKKYTLDTISESKEFVGDMLGKSYVNKINTDSLYTLKTKEGFRYDANKYKIDLYNYKIVNGLYNLSINLVNEYKKYGYDVTTFNNDLRMSIKRINIDTKSFKEIVLELKNGGETTEEEAFNKYSFLKEALEVLGFEGISDCKYVITNIKAKLLSRTSSSEESKVMRTLLTNSYFKSGEFYSNGDVVSSFASVYEKLGLNKLVKKSTIIKDYYDVKIISKKIDGKTFRGYIVYNNKSAIK